MFVERTPVRGFCHTVLKPNAIPRGISLLTIANPKLTMPVRCVCLMNRRFFVTLVTVVVHVVVQGAVALTTPQTRRSDVDSSDANNLAL